MIELSIFRAQQFINIILISKHNKTKEPGVLHMALLSCKDIKKAHCFYNVLFNNLAGAEGFEPPIIGPKPIALPLGHAPKETVKFLSTTTLA